MKTMELRNQAAALVLKRLELVESLGDRNLVAVETVPEDTERFVLAAGRELAGVTLGRRTRLLREIDAALGRIEDGTYGVCEDCECDINPRRLQAIPWARYCVACQERHDRGPSTAPEFDPQLSLAA
jgi:DnaK suppressor protein